jgi:hypothetical protein
MLKDRTGQILAYWMLERYTTRSEAPGLSREDFGTEKMHSLYIKYFQRSNYWGPMPTYREGLMFLEE